MEPGRLHCAELRKCLFIPATLTVVALHAAGCAWREVCGRVATIVPFCENMNGTLTHFSPLSLRFSIKTVKKERKKKEEKTLNARARERERERERERAH